MEFSYGLNVEGLRCKFCNSELDKFRQCDCIEFRDYAETLRNKPVESQEDFKSEIKELKTNLFIPMRYKDAKLSDFKGKNLYDNETAERLNKYILNLRENIINGNGLAFYGSIGCGKTRLAYAVAIYAIENLHITVKEIDSEDYFDRYFDSKNKKELVEKYGTADLLIFDDLATDKIELSAFKQQKLKQLLDYRYKRKKSTILTFNNSPIELMEKIGSQNFDRLKEMTDLIKLTGKSKRVNKTWG